MSFWRRWLTTVIVVSGFLAAMAGGANGETRSLKLYHLHTQEKANIVYKRNGRYDPEGLRKIDIILRDWRRNESTKIDPRLLDLVWEVYRASGATDYIQVVCGYRSPATNSLLRSRSNGVAEKSQHMLGKAMDFYIPGVPLKKLRNIGLQMQDGGVGYYPTSGSPFVHMDVGNVRHWPGIGRQELARLFPSGKTLHVPSDGRPLPGYKQAVAAYKARKGAGAPAIELASASRSTRKSRGLLAAFFGGGSDESDDSADVATTAPASKPRTVKPASAGKSSNLPGTAIVAPHDAQRTDIPQVADDNSAGSQPQRDTPETILAALPARSIPLPDFATRPKADVGAQTPQNVSFSTADATAGQAAASAQEPSSIPSAMVDPSNVADPAEVAFNNIPPPTWRPDRSLPDELAPQDKHVLLALAATVAHDQSASDFSWTKPIARSERAKVKADLDEYQVASLPVPSSASSDPAGVNPAWPRRAISALTANSDPVTAIGVGVKTTPKEARATAGDPKHSPRAVAVVAAPEATRWALSSSENIATVSNATKAPRYAYNIVHTPPSEVYMAGFQPNNQIADANRFTGNAVRFLSIARFSPVGG